MVVRNLLSVFRHYRFVSEFYKKTFVANAVVYTSRGTKALRYARKYIRPKDLEDPNYYGIGPKKEVISAVKSIAKKGFARERSPYNPPADVEEQLFRICKNVYGTKISEDWKDTPLSDPLLKYKFLTKCIQQFKYDIPNSYLHDMTQCHDIYDYFNTPVEGCLHFDSLIRDSDKLPPNLHVMNLAPDFDPDTDTFFGGLTAYPGRRRIIHTKAGEKFEKIIQWPNI